MPEYNMLYILDNVFLQFKIQTTLGLNCIIVTLKLALNVISALLYILFRYYVQQYLWNMFAIQGSLVLQLDQ